MRNIGRLIGFATGLVCLGAVIAPGARASSSIWTVTGNESGGNPINATALFTTGAGFIDVKVANLESNPNTVAQNISDLFFTLNSGTTTGSTLDMSSGIERTVHSDGSFTDSLSTVSTGWVLTTSGSTFHLDDLAPGAVGPLHTIIGGPGSGGYTNAGGAIAGNGPHNPFLAGTVDFVVDISGVTANTQVTSVTFSFGTTSGNNKGGTRATPEAGSVLSLGGLLIGGGAGLWLKRRRLRKSNR